MALYMLARVEDCSRRKELSFQHGREVEGLKNGFVGERAYKQLTSPYMVLLAGNLNVREIPDFE